MRKLAVFAIAFGISACHSEPVGESGCANCLTTAPLLPGVSATTSAQPATGAPSSLEVSALLKNGTPLSFSVGECPLRIRLSPYPPGSYGSGSADGCPPGSPANTLAPGDSVTIVRTLGADTLSLFAPGQYQVSVDVTVTGPSYGYIMGVAAGVVQLPLDTATP
jgi:hypothetical protein